jgi:hypothetical protein
MGGDVDVAVKDATLLQHTMSSAVCRALAGLREFA